jgi:hypothetical protein
LNGCAKTPAPTVIKINDFCEGRYESLTLEARDLKVIEKIRESEYFVPTIDKLLNNHVINEREFKECLK